MTYDDDDDDALCDFVANDNFYSNEVGVDNSGEEEPRGDPEDNEGVDNYDSQRECFIDEDGYDILMPYDLNLKGEKLSIVEIPVPFHFLYCKTGIIIVLTVSDYKLSAKICYSPYSCVAVITLSMHRCRIPIFKVLNGLPINLYHDMVST